MFDIDFSTEDGTSYGFWVVGHVTFAGVVYLANLKIMTFSSAFSIAQGGALGGSFLICLGVWVWVSGFNFGVLEYTFMR